MKTAWRQSYRLMIIVVVVIGMLTGCASVFQNLDDKMHRKQFKSAYEAFEKALAVYDEGDLDEALTRFKALSASTTSEKIARKAWLGEICCRLLLADTQAKYTTAIGMWHDFGRSALSNEAIWDPALLDPLIVRMTPKSTTQVIYIHSPAEVKPLEKMNSVGIPPEEMPSESAAPAERKQDVPQLQAELADMKKKVERAARLQRRMEAVVAENRSLKEKIKALEAIDQNIQKKKTEIAAPSE